MILYNEMDLQDLQEALQDEDVEIIVDDDLVDTDFDEEDIVDQAKYTFTKHTKSVFSCDLSGNGQLAISGSEDDTAFVWEVETGDVVLECTGHKDSVTHVGFNKDSKMVVTGDMSGMIQVWSLQDKKLVWCYEGDDVEWLFWHPMVNALVCGFTVGSVYVWQIPDGQCKVMSSSNNVSSTCGQVTPDWKHLLTGYSDGQIKLWNIKDTSPLWTNTNNETVTNVQINSDGTLAFTCPAGQLIKMSDGKTISTFLINNEPDIEVALFTDFNILITGSLSGMLCTWDLNKQSLRHQALIPASITALQPSWNGTIAVGTTEGALFLCDIKTLTLLETLAGHRGDILSMKVFAEKHAILTTSDDSTVKIFEIGSI